jgi:hypothetical protein
MADGTTVDTSNRVQQRRVEPPPPPPPPPPKVEPQQQAQQRAHALAGEAAANERRGDASRNLLAQRTNQGTEPPQPGRNSTRVAQTAQLERATPAPVAKAPEQPAQPAAQPAPATATATAPAPAPAEQPSAARRFLGGLWSGVKSGVVGAYEGAKALVTDPVGTVKAAGNAIGRAAEATADYGKRLVTNPGETLQQTAEWGKQKIEDIKNAKAEDWGKFIGETAVGAVGAYGAGKALQGIRALRAANAIAAKAPDIKAPVKPNIAPEVKAPAVKPDVTPEVKAPAVKPDAKPDVNAPAKPNAKPNDPLHNPASAHTKPFPEHKLSNVGLLEQGGLRAAEKASIDKFTDALNAHNTKFGLNKDLPPSALGPVRIGDRANRAGDRLTRVHADIRRADNSANTHLKPDDLAGRVKEKRGVKTRGDHVDETNGAYKNLAKSVEQIDGYLKKNPNLPEAQRRYLTERRDGHAQLKTILEKEFGLGQRPN